MVLSWSPPGSTFQGVDTTSNHSKKELVKRLGSRNLKGTACNGIKERVFELFKFLFVTSSNFLITVLFI